MLTPHQILPIFGHLAIRQTQDRAELLDCIGTTAVEAYDSSDKAVGQKTSKTPPLKGVFNFFRCSKHLKASIAKC